MADLEFGKTLGEARASVNMVRMGGPVDGALDRILDAIEKLAIQLRDLEQREIIK